MKMHIDLKREGFQMTLERRRSNAEWPAWLNAAWNTPITDVGAVYPDPNDPDRSNGRVCVNVHPDGCSYQVVKWNEWIIREADGRLWVTDSTDPVIANIEIPAGPALKQAPDMMDEAFRLRRELDETKAELAEAKRNYVGACQTIAAMHAAAVGAIQGPIRGVVEDVAALRAEVLELRAKRPNQAAIDQVAETLCSLVGDDGRFREDIRRELRENFGEFGVNEFPELQKLRGYYRQIVATLGDDAVISRVQAQAKLINALTTELKEQHAKQTALAQQLRDAETHADRLATALSWLAEMACDNHAGVRDALRAHSMRRGADYQDAGPIQSPALVPAKKLPRENTSLLYPGVHQFKGVICARDVIVTGEKLGERTKLVIMDDVLFVVIQAMPFELGTVLIVEPSAFVMETDDEEDAKAALALTEKSQAEGTLARLRQFPRLRHVGIQPKPLPTHPVDAMKQLGVQMDPDAERELRAQCDAPVDVSTMDGGPAGLPASLAASVNVAPVLSGVRSLLKPAVGEFSGNVKFTPEGIEADRMTARSGEMAPGVLEQCGREHAAAMDKIAHVPTREEMARHDETSHRCDSCREGFTCWANRTAPCLKRTDPDGVAEDEKGL